MKRTEFKKLMEGMDRENLSCLEIKNTFNHEFMVLYSNEFKGIGLGSFWVDNFLYYEGTILPWTASKFMLRGLLAGMFYDYMILEHPEKIRKFPLREVA